MAESCDPLELQAKLATAMLAADAPLLNLYFVNDHFVPYQGANPWARATTPNAATPRKD